MKFNSISNRFADLEYEAYAGLISTTGRDGKRTWMKHSGISALREILHAEYQSEKAGHDLTKADLSPELAEDLDLWARAEIPKDSGALTVMVRDEARRILGRCVG